MFVETIFGWPGMGRLMVTSIVSRDYPVVLGCAATRAGRPATAVNAAKGAGEVRTTFRLDSLTAGGRFAWISMKGTLRRDESAPLSRSGDQAGSLSGTLVGSMRLDRRRGWVVATYTEMTVKSTVSTAGAPGAPMHVTVHVTQAMRAEERD